MGNLKFSQTEKEENQISIKQKKFFRSKNIWCASSTHNSEEILIGTAHKKLKKKYKNLITIIIPRHIERTTVIINQLEQLNLNVHCHSYGDQIKKNTDIYLVDAYGKTKSFYRICKIVFLGGSIIRHGGQNPVAGTCGHQTRYLDQRSAQNPKCIALSPKHVYTPATRNSGLVRRHGFPETTAGPPFLRNFG